MGRRYSRCVAWAELYAVRELARYKRMEHSSCLGCLVRRGILANQVGDISPCFLLCVYARTASCCTGAGTQLALLRGRLIPTASTAPQPSPSAEQIARARATAFSGEDGGSGAASARRSQGIGSPPSMAATAAQAALRRYCRADLLFIAL